MQFKTAGLVLRETRVSESSELLTLLTPDLGKISVKARGALRKNSPLSSACQLFAFSEFSLFEKGGFYTAEEASPVELFCELRQRVEALALAAYISEVLEALADADSGAGELLRLGLNALFALSEGTAPDGIVKAAFEMRAACEAGFLPDLGKQEACACLLCGEKEPLFLCPEAGGVYCRTHLPPDSASLLLENGAAEALSYVCTCDAKRLFSFRLEPRGLRRFGAAAEGYLACCTGRHFSTLDYYKQFEYME